MKKIKTKQNRDIHLSPRIAQQYIDECGCDVKYFLDCIPRIGTKRIKYKLSVLDIHLIDAGYMPKNPWHLLDKHQRVRHRWLKPSE